MGERGAEGEVQFAREHPPEEEVHVEEGVDLRPHHGVEAVVVPVIGFPSERKAEIPFVVERQAARQAGDARSLEQVGRDGIAQLLRIGEVVVGDAEPLIDTAVSPVRGRSRPEAEGVFQVCREREIDGQLREVLAPKKGVDREDMLGPELRADTVRQPPGPLSVALRCEGRRGDASAPVVPPQGIPDGRFRLRTLLGGGFRSAPDRSGLFRCPGFRIRCDSGAVFRHSGAVRRASVPGLSVLLRRGTGGCRPGRIVRRAACAGRRSGRAARPFRRNGSDGEQRQRPCEDCGVQVPSSLHFGGFSVFECRSYEFFRKLLPFRTETSRASFGVSGVRGVSRSSFSYICPEKKR